MQPEGLVAQTENKQLVKFSGLGARQGAGVESPRDTDLFVHDAYPLAGRKNTYLLPQLPPLLNAAAVGGRRIALVCPHRVCSTIKDVTKQWFSRGHGGS